MMIMMTITTRGLYSLAGLYFAVCCSRIFSVATTNTRLRRTSFVDSLIFLGFFVFTCRPHFSSFFSMLCLISRHTLSSLYTSCNYSVHIRHFVAYHKHPSSSPAKNNGRINRRSCGWSDRMTHILWPRMGRFETYFCTGGETAGLLSCWATPFDWTVD